MKYFFLNVSMIVKFFILKLAMSFWFSFFMFIITNSLLAEWYYYNIDSNYTSYSLLLHTFIATLTLSIPEFIQGDKLFAFDTWLNLIIFFHMLFAYIFLGIFISMIYRKLTRT